MQVQGPGQALHQSVPAQRVHPLCTGNPLPHPAQPQTLIRTHPQKSSATISPQAHPHLPSPQAQFPGTFPVCDINQAPTPEGESGDSTVNLTR